MYEAVCVVRMQNKCLLTRVFVAFSLQAGTRWHNVELVLNDVLHMH